MLEMVVYRLRDELTGQMRELAGRLAADGIVCRELAEVFTEDVSICGGYSGKLREESCSHMLFLTDSSPLARRMCARGVTCIGVEETSNPYFDGAELVTDSLSWLNGRLLEECLRRAHGIPVTIAREGNLTLREMIPDDFDILYAISRQAGMEIARWDAEGENSFSPEYLDAYIRHQYRWYGYGLWSVLMDHTVIGCCGFSEAGEEWEDRRDRSGSGLIWMELSGLPDAGRDHVWMELSGLPDAGRDHVRMELSGLPDAGRDHVWLEMQYMLDEAFRGRGIGTRMCRAAITYAEEALGAERIFVRVHPENMRALHFARQMGFVPEE